MIKITSFFRYNQLTEINDFLFKLLHIWPLYMNVKSKTKTNIRLKKYLCIHLRISV